MFNAQVDEKLIKNIRLAVNKGMALGSGRIKDEIEQMCSCWIKPEKMDRFRFNLEDK
ncbi:hypothetical protein [Neptunomonas antarctica]|uniref:Putative transposase n=1 Tax=Neptunomonas antarctica TaxID=619304 RepID=A0A1N7JW63_9GAMM|nr:hypothetical protein [Neptunomonas antarctica]SIS53589.1 putative transposase [Neptunomonas antarctica]